MRSRSIEISAVVLGLVAACGGQPTHRASRSRPAPATPGPTPVAPVAAATAPSPACASPEHHQFDFWLGDWDLVVRARNSPGAAEWSEAHGTQHVEAILGGCAISENFTADGPGVPWAGKSYSVWQPAQARWRQTWVDDQGGYLAFTGGVEDGVMALYGEPRQQDGKEIRMRMVFLDVTPTSMRWEWQRTVDGGATWEPQMVIDYARPAPPPVTGR